MCRLGLVLQCAVCRDTSPRRRQTDKKQGKAERLRSVWSHFHKYSPSSLIIKLLENTLFTGVDFKILTVTVPFAELFGGQIHCREIQSSNHSW